MTTPPSQKSTLHYKLLNGTTPISFDVYFPDPISPIVISTDSESGPIPIPVVIYFHGGGLCVGNRESWFPTWLYRRVISLGYAFLSADHRLLPPATGHEIVQDLKDLFYFLSTTEVSIHPYKFKLDTNKIAVSGSSAGGLCAYLAAMHCSPKPKAIVSMYGMGGNFLTPHYFTPKEKPFFRGRDLLDPADFSDYLYPFPNGPLPPLSESHLAYHPQTYRIPGYPANKRMLLSRLYLQLGVYLDYYTGMHQPSLSLSLRQHTVEDTPGRLVAPEHHSLFPQLQMTGENPWPPTMLLHGKLDTAVPVGESRYLKDLLLSANVPVELVEFDEQEHNFDYQPDAEERWAEKFDGVKYFLKKHLGSEAEVILD
ncbi:putative carboxylesterase M8 [Psilocybe cubensis]|uniref:Carboxylesterase M8 n=2 Tax=Psilocybe cubensis TaxID=181762 RepID=A0ACB8GZ81_PSICU|nr:putative carboxylesterase M8 [Psilocybe cubensis]KAH9480737.1 putative carboxylesterase M8 [Psilocybe cubensis]